MSGPTKVPPRGSRVVIRPRGDGFEVVGPAGYRARFTSRGDAFVFARARGLVVAATGARLQRDFIPERDLRTWSRDEAIADAILRGEVDR
jgi:hypothetical protein